MPELPEVEVVRQSLEEKIKYRKIIKVIVRNRNLRFKIPFNFEKILKGQKIMKINRFSKYLILSFSDNIFCLLHLGMSGTIHLVEKGKNYEVTNTSFYNSPSLPKKHNHLEIFFKNIRIIYNDPRRFGFFQIIKGEDQLKKRFENLGPEPFDIMYDEKYLYSFFRNKKKNIKNFLLDQNFVSGIGNIYASEILFFSKINPLKKASSLSKKNCKDIVIFSRQVLLDAIEKGGSSIRDFKNISGKKGNFQKDFKVYQRENESCKRFNCKGIIRKKNISNRSSFFCNRCQK